MMTDTYARELDRSLVCLYRRRSRFMAEHMRTYGLVGPMYSLILNIDRNPGASQELLASYFSIDKGTTARYAKHLEKLGLVMRKMDPADRRIYQLFLTEAGLRLLPQIRAKLDQWRQQLLDGFTDEDSQAAFEIIRRMTENSSKMID